MGRAQAGDRVRLPWRRGARDTHGGRRSVRGAAEVSVLAVVASLVTGVFFGSGISSTAVDLADGLTWIGDGPSGEVIQVNPATGRPQLRLQVAQPGDDLTLAQYDGRLFVTNRTTGQLQSFDLTRVLRSAARRVTQGEVVETLVRDGELYLVDRDAATVARLDPETLDELGTIWTAPAGLADAVLDETGDVWALEDDGALHRLDWSDGAAAFEETERTQLELSGPGSVLVAHDDAVTVFGPDQGVVVQVGTSPAVDADAPRLGGTLLAPESSPPDLVPASAPDTGTVVLTTPAGVLEVDVAAIGCGTPGTPEVFDGIVYVPCTGDSKVVRLGSDGQRALPDIETPGSPDPELVVDDGHLIVNTPGAEKGAVVDGDGTVTDLVRLDPTVPVTVPGTTTTPPPTRGSEEIEEILRQGREKREQKREVERKQTTSTPTPTTPTSTPTRAPAVTLPTLAAPSGGPTGLPSGFPSGLPSGLPTRVPTGGPSGAPTTDPTVGRPPVTASTPTTAPTTASPTAPTTAPTSAPTSAQPTAPLSPTSTGGPVTVAPPTQSPTPTTGPTQPPTTVDPSLPTQTSQAPTALTAPTAVTTTVVSSTQVRVTWVHPGADQYVVSRASGAVLATVPGGNRQATVTVTPGEASSFVVTARSGSASAASGASAPVTTADVPGAPPGVAITQSYPTATSAQFVVTWGAAADNGAAISEYRVVVTTSDGVDWTATTNGSGRSATLTKECADGCQIAGQFGTAVTAYNSQGTGGTGRAGGTAPAPPQVPMPSAGAQLVTSQDTSALGIEGYGQTTLTLAPPADWAQFSGTCEYIHDGNQAGMGDANVAFPCDARSITVQVNNGIRREPNNGQSSHSLLISARSGTRVVNAQTFSWTTSQPVLCQGCQIP